MWAGHQSIGVHSVRTPAILGLVASSYMH